MIKNLFEEKIEEILSNLSQKEADIHDLQLIYFILALENEYDIGIFSDPSKDSQDDKGVAPEGRVLVALKTAMEDKINRKINENCPENSIAFIKFGIKLEQRFISFLEAYSQPELWKKLNEIYDTIAKISELDPHMRDFTKIYKDKTHIDEVKLSQISSDLMLQINSSKRIEAAFQLYFDKVTEMSNFNKAIQYFL